MPYFLNTDELDALIEAGAKDSRNEYKIAYKMLRNFLNGRA